MYIGNWSVGNNIITLDYFEFSVDLDDVTDEFLFRQVLEGHDPVTRQQRHFSTRDLGFSEVAIIAANETRDAVVEGGALVHSVPSGQITKTYIVSLV